MKALSASFVLGKLSTGDANVAHNNRETIAGNVDVSRIAGNIIYVQDDVRDVYDEIFSEALEAYNAKQKQPCRRIHDYYVHIFEGSREEAFYELVVQFGDMKTAGIGSENGEIAKKMLDDYMRGFKERNKNLHIFSGNLHMDEASPHLHINFIPFYTEGRKNGLSKGVSMKAALIEQGFKPKSQTQNQLYLWQESEKAVMEEILRRYNFKRDVKDADYAHQSVPDYKESQDAKRLRELMQVGVPRNEINAENVDRLKRENSLLEIEKEKATVRERSPWKSFYYSESDKQSFVQAELAQLKIPFRETDNGFEAQEHYIQEIRKIEKQFKAPATSHREELRNHLDKFVMQSDSFDEVLERLEKQGYEIKQAKYLAVKPKFSSQFIRVKSLGEFYNEQALRNRVESKKRYETEIDDKWKSIEDKESLRFMLRATVKQYIFVFKKNLLPARKTNPNRPFAWSNDAELSRLAELNKKINDGITVESLRSDFTQAEKTIAHLEERLETLKADLKHNKYLNDVLERYNSSGNYNDLVILEKHEITHHDYFRLKKNIIDNESQIEYVEKSLSENRTKVEETAETLSAFEKIASATYVHSLMDAQRHKEQSKYIKNGLKSAETDDLNLGDKVLSNLVKSGELKITKSGDLELAEPEKQPYKSKTR